MRFPTFLLLAAGLLLTACKPSAPAAGSAGGAGVDAAPVASTPAEAKPVETPPTAPSPAKPPIEAAFAKGMPYATLRKQLLDAGWLPLRDPMCWQNIGGEARVCRELPEVESCSGDGYCNMRFANAAEGRRISVTTYGPYERWDAPGEEASVALQTWEIAKIDDASSAPACPAKDFDGFLKAFASDESVEKAFTASLVQVAELGGGEDGDDTRMVYESGRDYDQFLLHYRDGKWYGEPVEGGPAPSPIEVATRPERAGAYFVSIPRSIEGTSYRFERRGDCWQLTADPEVVP